jgi:ABC-2 type transport system permease protein
MHEETGEVMRRQLSNIFRLGLKELRSLLRDPVLLVLVIYIFTLNVYEAGQRAGEGSIQNAAVAIVDEDRSPLSRRLAQAFHKPHFKAPEFIAFDAIDHAMEGGDYPFVIVIPPHFQADVDAGRQPALQVNVDATHMSQAGIGASYIQHIIHRELREFATGMHADPQAWVQLVARYKFNPSLNQSWHDSLVELIDNVTLFAILLAGAAVMREREHGTLEHLLVMPLTPVEIIAAKVWANGLVIIVMVMVSLLWVVHGLLAVPILGSVFLFALGVLLYLFSTTAIGIMLATVARSMPQLGLLVVMAVVPMNMLSGNTTPLDAMPELLQMIMKVAPTTHFVSVARAILYRGAGFDVVWPSFLTIFALGVVFFLIALVRFRKTVTVATT